MIEVDNGECINMDEGQLVFEQRETLSEVEKELADIHIGCCLSCRMEMEFEQLMDRIDREG